MNPEENPPRKLRRTAHFGKKDEIEVYYECFENKADGETQIEITGVSRPSPVNSSCYDPCFTLLNTFIEASGGTWEQAIANAPLVTDEDGEIIRRN